MIKTGKFTRIAAVAVVGLSLVVPAAASAQSRRGDNAIVGGLIGALAGGLIGGDATGALVGAGAGALIGSASTPSRGYGRYGYNQRYNGRGAYGRGGYRGAPAYGYGRYGQAQGYGGSRHAQPAYGYYGR